MLNSIGHFHLRFKKIKRLDPQDNRFPYVRVLFGLCVYDQKVIKFVACDSIALIKAVHIDILRSADICVSKDFGYFAITNS